MIWLILFCLCCCSVEGLKCRAQEGYGEAELKRVVRSCMHRSGNDNGNGNNNGNAPDDNEGNRGYGRKVNRYDYGQEQDGRTNNGYRWQRRLKQTENRNSSESEGGQCVAQCFFEEMNIADGNGLPDRRKVSYILTKDLRDRELRNFFMDTVQQCFRYLENSRNRNNKCSQSRDLIKCMSEYAKAQCDDWEEYGSLLFN
ncbi:odorant-binding protein 59a-like [Drosophila miranda]|uniref:odorant-binding protein 59a-like n=1 Tax=Drosophila miranda TaxID=7229 RepID=UPI00143F22EB|nr:odorant-binding protein 59a-like [Drosophila miranda]